MSQQQSQSILSQTALARLRQSGPGDDGDGRRPLFTGELSVNEFALLQDVGFQPLGLVMGSSMYHIGYQFQTWNQSQELQVLTQAMYTAREYAMARMEAEADTLGADGIVGVRLEYQRYPWADDLLEFVAVGTAVRASSGSSSSGASAPASSGGSSVGTAGGSSAGTAGGSSVGGSAGATWRTLAGKLFTTDLSGQELWTLVRTGHAPVSLVLGTCVYHVAHQSFRQMWKTVGQNAEMPNFTQATYDAREIAMARMQAEADRDGAEGIVGVRVQQESFIWGDNAIEFLALGTAVRRLSEKPAGVPAPALMLPMAD